jgi:hypothetical protein
LTGKLQIDHFTKWNFVIKFVIKPETNTRSPRKSVRRRKNKAAKMRRRYSLPARKQTTHSALTSSGSRQNSSPVRLLENADFRNDLFQGLRRRLVHLGRNLSVGIAQLTDDDVRHSCPARELSCRERHPPRGTSSIKHTQRASALSISVSTPEMRAIEPFALQYVRNDQRDAVVETAQTRNAEH